jgi:hypothetical protein
MQPFHTVHHVTTLTNAQIKALPTTPVDIVATPGAGQILLPISVTYKANFAAGAYTNVNDTASLQVTFDGSTDSELGRGHFFPQAGRWSQVQVGSIKRRDIVNQATASLGFAMLGFADTALQVAMDNASDGNLTGGHASNVLIVDTNYIVLDVPAVLRLVAGNWVIDDDPSGAPPDGYLTTPDGGATLIISRTAERGLALAITDGSPEAFYP